MVIAHYTYIKLVINWRCKKYFKRDLDLRNYLKVMESQILILA